MESPFDIAADLDTPVSAYMKLKAFGPCFLLESVESGERLACYSFVGLGSRVSVELHAEALRGVLGNPQIPPRFNNEVLSGKVIPLSKLPDHLEPEVWIGVLSRADRMGDGIVFELKPNSPGAIAKGLKYLEGRVKLLNDSAHMGRTDWRGIVVVYDKAAAKLFVRR